jgi:protein SEY1
MSYDDPLGTLLNMLFGTEFAVMRDDKRQQTTKGIWIAFSREKDNILVMDMEGTDSREHGEHQDFERRTALFTLAVAEVLLINMWEHSIGLYNGANYGLFKTILEVHLQLFQQKE